LLARPELGGGTKVVLQHAALLAGRGHEVTVAGDGALPALFGFRGRYLDLEREPPPRGQDLVVATFWTTLGRARALDAGPVAHFCQGYEGEIPHFAADREAIERAYADPAPVLAVTPRLADLIAARFGRPARLAPPSIDRAVRPRSRWRPRRRPWIALFGVFEATVKGIPTGLAALGRLRALGCRARLLRLSVLPLGDAERALAAPDRYLVSVAPRAALAALAGCDLLLFPSGVEEGFGLPLLEAMALGVPAVASETAGLRFVAGAGGARLVAPGDDAAMAAAAAELLGSAPAWRAQRRAGRAAAERFAPERIAPEIEAALTWAAAAAAGGR
jgi:glycosyltransferase involved in cell wall biosynthesis